MAELFEIIGFFLITFSTWLLWMEHTGRIEHDS